MFPAALSSRPWESEICAHTHHLIGWLGSNGSLGGDVSLYLCITLDHLLAIQRALHLRFVGVECVRVCASVCVQCISGVCLAYYECCGWYVQW